MTPQTTSFARGPDGSSLFGRVGLPSESALFVAPGALRFASNQISDIFRPESTPADEIHTMSRFTLTMTGLIFAVVFTLLVYAIVKFRASGPPGRGLFEYRYKIENGNLLIQAGELPTPGSPAASLVQIGEFPCG